MSGDAFLYLSQNLLVMREVWRDPKWHIFLELGVERKDRIEAEFSLRKGNLT